MKTQHILLLGLIVGCSSCNMWNLYDDTGNSGGAKDPLSQGLIVHYPLDGNANDKGKYHFNGVVNEAIPCTNRHNANNKAMYFDGKKSNIIVENFGSIVPTKEISVAMWIKTEKLSSHMQLTLLPDTETRLGISVDYSHRFIRHTFWDFGYELGPGNARGRLYESAETLDNAWHFYVFISSTDGGFMKIYKDGNLIAFKSDPYFLSNVNNKKLAIGSGNNSSYFNGGIDDIRIYNRVLSENEIQQLFKQ